MTVARQPDLVDGVPHHRIVVASMIGALLTTAETSTGAMLGFLVVGMALMGLSFGPMSAVLPELFPTNVRYTGSGVAYNAASILGAAVAPFIATWLSANRGVGWVGVYLSIAAALSFVALLVMHETRDIALDGELADHVGDALHPG